MTNTWLTIITVHRNDGEALQRTLNSVAASLGDGLEYIVVDSSTDHTEIHDMVTRVCPQARVVWTDPDGVYAAMNEGLRLATGSYIYFLNAGDALIATGLECVKRASVNEPDWMTGPVEVIGQDAVTTPTPEWSFAQESKWSFARGRFPAHQGTIVRTEKLLAIGGFDTSYVVAADYASMLQLSKSSSPTLLRQPLARFYEGGLSTQRWSRAHREFHRARREILRPTGMASLREYCATGLRALAEGSYRSVWPVTAMLLLAGVAVLLGTGVDLPSAAQIALVVLTQGVAGAALWRIVAGDRAVSVLALIGAGLGLGTAASMVAGLIWQWWLFPASVLIAWLVMRTRRRGSPLEPLDRSSALAVGLGIVAGVASMLFALRSYPLAWTSIWQNYHGDMPFFEALATSVVSNGPGASIFMTGEDLRYHSLAYGWAGQITAAVDAAPFVVLTRVLPLVTLIGTVTIAAAWARTLNKQWWVPSLAVLLIVTGGFVGATFGGVINFDSPSQSLTTLWLLVFTVLFLQAARGGGLVLSGLVLSVLAFALAGGKVSTAAVAVGGIVGVLAIAWLRKSVNRARASTLTLFSLSAMLVAYWLLVEGSANAGGLELFQLVDRASSVQGLNPVVTPRGIVAGIAILILAVVPRWAGLLWWIGARETRWSPETGYGIGLALVGVGTIVALSGGFNDLWFAVAASAPLAVLSASGLGSASQWLNDKKRLMLAAVGGLFTSIIVAALWMSGSTGIIGNGWRWAASSIAWILAGVVALLLARKSTRSFWGSAVVLMMTVLVVASVPSRAVYAAAQAFVPASDRSLSTVLFTPPEPYVRSIDSRKVGISSDELAAGSWLRSQAEVGDLVATNRTADAIVPALTRLPTYISNIHIQGPYGREESVPEIQRRDAESHAFINSPSTETLQPLCTAGVTWLWIDRERAATDSWLPYATTVWESPDVIIARVDDSQC